MRDLVDELLHAKVKARLFGGEHAPRLGRLVLLDRIGSGAMGTVFAAYDPRLDRKVAVKVVRSAGTETTDRVLREARALGKLAHPNVVAIHDADTLDGDLYIVMELAPGIPLRAWLGDDHDWREIVRVMRESGAGIAAAHRAGLVHRDIKPDNILIGDDRARVVDFGLAHDRIGEDDGASAGTPSYMAPEVLAGAAASERSDQFSFGVALYEALYGARPHDGKTRIELHVTAQQAANATPADRRPASRRPPAWVHAIVVRALAGDPDQRFRSMEALVAALGRDRRRRNRVIAIAGVALLAGATVGIVGYRSQTVGDPCAGAASRRTAVWNANTSAQVRGALGTSPWALKAAGTLDDLASHWETSYRNVCEASRVHGDQSDTLLDLRMRCLGRALDRLGALKVALAEPLDPATRAEAAKAIAELPRPIVCETISEAGELALPSDPTQRERVATAEHDLDRAWASFALGRYKEARTAITAIESHTAELDVPPLRAAVFLLAGSIETRTGAPAAARKLLDRALAAAATARAAELELEVWSSLLRHELFAGSPSHVVEWAPFALAAASRAGREGADIQSIVGEALRNEGQLTAARDTLRKALASRDPLRPDERALVEMNIGSVELATGNPVAAEAAFRRGLELARGALGEGFPGLVVYVDKLAATDRARGRIRAALASHDQGLAIRRAAFGDTDRSVATSMLYRARTLIEAGQLTRAVQDLEAARVIRAKLLGDTSPRLGEIDAALGDAAAAANRLADARALYDRAASLDPRLDLAARRFAAGASVPPDAFPQDPDPLSVDRAAGLAARIAQTPRDRAFPLALALHARWRTAGPSLDPALSLSVAEALLTVGDRGSAAMVARAALAMLADEPSRTRLHAFRLLARALPSPDAEPAGAAARALAAQLPELREP